MKNILVFLLVLIFLAAGVYYFLTRPKPEPNLPIDNLSGNPAEEKLYESQNYNFEIAYPPQYTKTEGGSPNYNVGEFFVGDGENVVTFGLPSDSYPGTNFYDGFLTVSAATGTPEADCLKAQREGDSNVVDLAGAKTINGLKFWRGITSGAAAGTLAENIIYHAFVGSTCFEITLNEFEGNIGNYPEGTASQVDKNDVFLKLESVLNTFKIKSETN